MASMCVEWIAPGGAAITPFRVVTRAVPSSTRCTVGGRTESDALRATGGFVGIGLALLTRVALGWPGREERTPAGWPVCVGTERPGRRQPGAALTGGPMTASPVSAYGQVVLPAQFFVARHGDEQSLRRLMVAVLGDAIRTYQKYVCAESRHGRALFRDAEAWIMEADDASPLRFESVCGAVDLDPGWVRRWLREWRARAVSGGGTLACASPRTRAAPPSRPRSRRPPGRSRTRGASAVELGHAVGLVERAHDRLDGERAVRADRPPRSRAPSRAPGRRARRGRRGRSRAPRARGCACR